MKSIVFCVILILAVLAGNIILFYILFSGIIKLNKKLKKEGKSTIKTIKICRNKMRICNDELKRYSGKIFWTVNLVIGYNTENYNASATYYPFIVFYNDWTFLAVDDENDGILYQVYGHELGHKDNEPFHNDKFTNHIREIRADFCGMKFACDCGYDKNTIIEAKYNPDKNPNYDKETFLHPSNKDRKYFLQKYDSFDVAIIDEYAEMKKYKNYKKIEKLKKNVFKGKVFSKGKF